MVFQTLWRSQLSPKKPERRQVLRRKERCSMTVRRVCCRSKGFRWKRSSKGRFFIYGTVTSPESSARSERRWANSESISLRLLLDAGRRNAARTLSRLCEWTGKCRLPFSSRFGRFPPSLRLNSCISIDFYKLGRRPPHFAETSRVHLDFDEGVPPHPPPFCTECGTICFPKVCCCGRAHKAG